MSFNEIKCHVNSSLGLVGGCIPCIPPCVRGCLCVPCYCDACLKSSALCVGVKTLHNTML